MILPKAALFFCIFWVPSPENKMANLHPGAGHELYLMTHLGTFILAIMKTSTYYTFLETLGLGQYNKTISKMFQKCFKDFYCHYCEYRATQNENIGCHIQSVHEGAKC